MTDTDQELSNRLRELALILAEVHVGDGDELGEVARQLYDLLVRKRCDYVGEPSEHSGPKLPLRCTQEVGHDGVHQWTKADAEAWQGVGQ